MRTEQLLRLNKLIGSPRAKFAGALALDLLGLRHLIVRMDPVFACNIRCAMCYFSDEKWAKEHPTERLSGEDIGRLAAMFLPKALQFHIGCRAEPTVYKGFADLVTLGKVYHVPHIGMVTNAQLLTAQVSNDLIARGLDEISISTHGIRRETYERMMKRASYDRLHENLRALVAAKKSAGSNSPRIRINYTVNPDNLPELRDFFTVFGDYEISTLQVRPIIDLGDTDYRNKDLAPYIAQYEETLGELAEECHKRDIALLANLKAPTYAKANPSTAVYEKAALRYIGPSTVWREDFDWHRYTYDQFKRQIGYRKELLGYVLSPPRQTNSVLATHELY